MLAVEAEALRAMRRAVARVTDGQRIDDAGDIERLALALFRALVPVVVRARANARMAAREAIVGEVSVIAAETNAARVPLLPTLDELAELDRARAVAKGYAIAWARAASERLAQAREAEAA